MKNLQSVFRSVMLFAMASVLSTGVLRAQDEMQKSAEIYGFIMMDAGYNMNQIHPDWFDVVRPTKLPTFKNQYGTDGNTYFSVRQTRFGIKNYFPTALGDLKTQFEFEMFGTGVDAGQTTIRLRHAYGELGKFGAGQYWSPFMDIDVFPNTVEYWGPCGMVFFRNVQFRYMPIQGDSRLTIALERPGASADGGVYSEVIQNLNLRAHFPLPDLSFEYRKAIKPGYIELAGIVRQMKWEDLDEVGEDLSGSALGWGLNLSTNLKIGSKVTFRGQAVYGQGIQNYMNDAPVDVAVEFDGTNIDGVALPVLGLVGFFDINWSDKLSSSIGYSLTDIDNAGDLDPNTPLDGQTYDAFSKGQYAVANLMYYPAKNVMMGVEYQYGSRENFGDSPVPNDNYLKTTSISKVQFSFKYNFSQTFYRNHGPM